MIKGGRASAADVARYRKVENHPTAAKASEKMRGTRQTSSGPRGGQDIGLKVVSKNRAEIMSGTRQVHHGGKSEPMNRR